jgi:hypothetical protein
MIGFTNVELPANVLISNSYFQQILTFDIVAIIKPFERGGIIGYDEERAIKS